MASHDRLAQPEQGGGMEQNMSRALSLQSLLVKPDMTSARFSRVQSCGKDQMPEPSEGSAAPSAFATAVCGKEDMVRRNQCNAYRQHRLRGGQVSLDRQSEAYLTLIY